MNGERISYTRAQNERFQQNSNAKSSNKSLLRTARIDLDGAKIQTFTTLVSMISSIYSIRATGNGSRSSQMAK